MTAYIPGEPGRDREAEVPEEVFRNGGDDDISSGEPGTRRASEPIAPTTPGAAEGPGDDVDDELDES